MLDRGYGRLVMISSGAAARPSAGWTAYSAGKAAVVQMTRSLALEIEGAHASLYLGDAHAPDGGQWPLAYLNSYGFTIAAGSNEIQRNILGERVLGLAKSK